MQEFVRVAAKISTMWSLAAFAIAAVLFLVLRQKGRGQNAAALTGIGAIVILGLIPIGASVLGGAYGLYEVRVMVLGPASTPTDDAKVWSSIGGEPKRVAGGWQFDIPSKVRPADLKVTFYASLESAFLNGNSTLLLGEEQRPSVMITLTPIASGEVRGMVVDNEGSALADALVFVSGYGDKENVVTKKDGGFSLPAHAAPGQQVDIHAEKPGYTTVNQFHPAGSRGLKLELRAIVRRRVGVSEVR